MERYDHGGDLYGNAGICLDFSVNTNPLGMPAAVSQVLASEPEVCSRYPDPHCRRLREALAKHHGLSAGNILCGNGAADLIFRVCAWKKAKNVLLPAPTFSEYERPVKLFGGSVREHPLLEENNFALTVDFAQAITEDTDLVFLCNPNNPTGCLIAPEVMEVVLRRCRETGAILLVDECFIEFTDGASLLPRLKEYPNLLILRAFTKLYAMAGLRLGYLAGASELLEQIAPYGAHWSVSGPAQAAGLAALEAEPEWTAMTHMLTAAERRFMTEQLKACGIKVYPSDANFLLLNSEAPLHEGVKVRGILTRSCANFTGLDRRYVRIGLKDHQQNLAFLDAVREVVQGASSDRMPFP